VLSDYERKIHSTIGEIFLLITEEGVEETGLYGYIGTKRIKSGGNWFQGIYWRKKGIKNQFDGAIVLVEITFCIQTASSRSMQGIAQIRIKDTKIAFPVDIDIFNEIVFINKVIQTWIPCEVNELQAKWNDAPDRE